MNRTAELIAAEYGEKSWKASAIAARQQPGGQELYDALQAEMAALWRELSDLRRQERLALEVTPTE